VQDPAAEPDALSRAPSGNSATDSMSVHRLAPTASTQQQVKMITISRSHPSFNGHFPGVEIPLGSVFHHLYQKKNFRG